LEISEYWRTLHEAGIDSERLASFDRPITSEPAFHAQQVDGLKADLQGYLVTLSAVHGGQDLHSAALAVLGYSQVRVLTVCLYRPISLRAAVRRGGICSVSTVRLAHDASEKPLHTICERGILGLRKPFATEG
jgi:hypothetical protein